LECLHGPLPLISGEDGTKGGRCAAGNVARRVGAEAREPKFFQDEGRRPLEVIDVVPMNGEAYLHGKPLSLHDADRIYHLAPRTRAPDGVMHLGTGTVERNLDAIAAAGAGKGSGAAGIHECAVGEEDEPHVVADDRLKERGKILSEEGLSATQGDSENPCRAALPEEANPFFC